MKKTLITIIIIIAAIVGYFAYNYNYVYDSTKFTKFDIQYGCYYGDISQKKTGTPDTWVLVNPGTKSAQWCAPDKAKGIVQVVK